MSYWVSLMPPTGKSADEIEVGNSTSNHVPAWTEALGFRLADLDGRKAGDCAAALWLGARAIRREPERFDELVRGDGSWGTWETAAEFLELFARKCESAHPDMRVEISR